MFDFGLADDDDDPAPDLGDVPIVAVGVLASVIVGAIGLIGTLTWIISKWG